MLLASLKSSIKISLEAENRHQVIPRYLVIHVFEFVATFKINYQRN